MRLDRVTITGADEGVTPYDLCVLSDEFPFVEWGVLLSATREGKEPRYPSREWLDNLWERTHHMTQPLAERRSMAFAGHLCGRWSRDAIGGAFIWAIERYYHFRRFSRLQFNGAGYTPDSVGRVSRYVKAFPGKRFVLQHVGFPADPPEPHIGRPDVLLDRSGGRGIELTEFVEPTPGMYCGYSGGLGPDNLEAVLTKLTALPGDARFWVDMESGVRTGDRFDLVKVRRCLKIAAPFVR